MTSDTLLKQYNDKHPNGYTKEEGAKIMKDKRYTDAKNAMKEKQKSGNLKDEYTGKTLKLNENANLDHVVARKQIFENSWRKIADIDTADLANKKENLAATNESLNKSKGAKSNSEYIKDREVREKNLKEQVERANKKIDKKDISDSEKRNLKAINEKRLNDKYILHDSAKETLKKYLELHSNNTENKNANGRFVRNVFDRIARSSARVKKCYKVKLSNCAMILSVNVLN